MANTAGIYTLVLGKKLRAIAKHASALADELAEIDEELCPKCKSPHFVIARLYAGGEEVDARCACDTCGYEGSVVND